MQEFTPCKTNFLASPSFRAQQTQLWLDMRSVSNDFAELNWKVVDTVQEYAGAKARACKANSPASVIALCIEDEIEPSVTHFSSHTHVLQFITRVGREHSTMGLGDL